MIMKRFLGNRITGFKMNKPRPAARPNHRARLSVEVLEARWAPSAFADIITGAGPGAPGGHVKVIS
jgi:hypothetical protein